MYFASKNWLSHAALEHPSIESLFLIRYVHCKFNYGKFNTWIGFCFDGFFHIQPNFLHKPTASRSSIKTNSRSVRKSRPTVFLYASERLFFDKSGGSSFVFKRKYQKKSKKKKKTFGSWKPFLSVEAFAANLMWFENVIESVQSQHGWRMFVSSTIVGVPVCVSCLVFCIFSWWIHRLVNS